MCSLSLSSVFRSWRRVLPVDLHTSGSDSRQQELNREEEWVQHRNLVPLRIWLDLVTPVLGGCYTTPKNVEFSLGAGSSLRRQMPTLLYRSRSPSDSVATIPVSMLLGCQGRSLPWCLGLLQPCCQGWILPWCGGLACGSTWPPRYVLSCSSIWAGKWILAVLRCTELLRPTPYFDLGSICFPRTELLSTGTDLLPYLPIYIGL